MKQVLGFLALALTFSASAQAASYTREPMKYAEDSSKDWAQGDTNDSRGWEGCHQTAYPNRGHVYVACDGTRTIFVHGGHEAAEKFTCTYEFKFDSRKKSYQVTVEDCE